VRIRRDRASTGQIAVRESERASVGPLSCAVGVAETRGLIFKLGKCRNIELSAAFKNGFARSPPLLCAAPLLLSFASASDGRLLFLLCGGDDAADAWPLEDAAGAASFSLSFLLRPLWEEIRKKKKKKDSFEENRSIGKTKPTHETMRTNNTINTNETEHTNAVDQHTTSSFQRQR
jgi:hypothetical protein